MSNVQVKKIYTRDEFIGNCSKSDGSINCDLVVQNNTKVVYLVPGKVPYMGPNLASRPPLDGPYIKGLQVNEAGTLIVIDAELEDFLSKCNECCGEDTVVTPVYTEYPSLEFDSVVHTFTVQIKDDGSATAFEKFAFKYTSPAGGYDFNKVSRNNGTQITTYEFKSSKSTVAPQLGPDGTTLDIITKSTVNVESGTVAALTTGQHHTVLVESYGNPLGTPSPFVGATNAAIGTVATALQASASYGALGTWSVVANKLRLATAIDGVEITVANVT